MQKIREWAFPVALIAAWVLAAAYTVSFLVEPERAQPKPVAAETEIVAS